MNRRKNHKKLNSNISKKENNNINDYQAMKRTIYSYGFILYFIISIIQDLYYLIALIILKLYHLLKLDEFNTRGYLLFFLLESISNGSAIYYIICFLIKFYDLYSPFNQEWAYIYIWIICTLQLLFLFTSFILFLMRYIYIQLFFLAKFKYLFSILSIIIILFNFSSLNDLNSDKYSFQIQNYENQKISNYKEYLKRHYVNLYLNKETDFKEYELCFEMSYPNNYSELFSNEPQYSLWKFENKKDYFMGCRNVSFDENPVIDKNNPLTFFKCDTTYKNNILPNYCVSAEHRRKKYDFIYKLNIFEIIILIAFFICVKLFNHIFYKYHLYTISKEHIDNNEEGENGEEEGEEGEDEGEEEEDDEEEEQEEEQEEVEEKINYRRYRKISKKKKKYYKKKNRFRKYNNKDNQDTNTISKEEVIKKKKKKENEKEEKTENKINNETINKDNDNNSIENKEKKGEKIINKNEDKNQEEEENIEDKNNFENNRPYKRNSIVNYLFLGSIVDKIKTKFYNILKEIDEEIKEDEKIK